MREARRASSTNPLGGKSPVSSAEDRSTSKCTPLWGRCGRKGRTLRATDL